MNKKIFQIEKKVLFGLTASYFLLACIYYISRDITSGDETLFLSDLAYIHQNGWYEAIRKNISVPYMLLVYPLSQFLENIRALRITNLILIISFFIYLTYTKRIIVLRYAYFLFYLGAAAFYFFGSNDTLFSLTLAVFLIEAYKCSRKLEFYPVLALTALIICFFTRQLFFLYLPVIIIGLYTMRKSFKHFTAGLYIPLTVFSLLLLLNFPSIQHNKGFSYDLKAPPDNINATWTQRQYLAQLWVNEGILPFHSHPTWKQTQDYLELHGMQSLPHGIISSIFFNIKTTATEFVKDFAYILLYHTRTIGLMFLIGIFLTAKDISGNYQLLPNYFMPIATMIMIIIFSLIIISYVELRWLGPVFLGSILFYLDLDKSKKIPLLLNRLNVYFLSFLSCYGMYGLFTRIISENF